MATELADRILVMVSGRIALETTAAKLLADEDAQRRYLGVEPLAAPGVSTLKPIPTQRRS